MLATIQEDISAPGSTQEPTGVEAEVPLVRLSLPEEISTIPLCPTQEEDPLEESLPFAPDMAEDLTPEQEQELLEEVSGYHVDTPITIKAEPSIWPTAAFINIHEHPL